MSKVSFCQLTQAQYDTLAAPETGTVYFLTDGKSLVLDGKEYTHQAKADRFLLKRTFANDTYGTAAYLDADNSMNLSGYFAEPITRIDLWLVSATPEITGNIVLTIGEESFTIPVVNTVTKATLNTNVSGRISIVRDTSNESDTLNDGTDAVTAIAVDWRCC